MAKAPKGLLARLKAMEEKALALFYSKQQKIREKNLKPILKKLKKEQAKQERLVKMAQSQIKVIEDQINEMLGKSPVTQPKQSKPAKTPGKRRRLTGEQKLALAGKVHSALKISKGKLSSDELSKHSDGIAPRLLVDVWNEAHKDEKIKHEGDKRGRKYFI